MASKKYCIVPMCGNTFYVTPDKIFLNVPRNKNDRLRWCRAIKRDPKKNVPLAEKSHRHVCEDHFDVSSHYYYILKTYRPKALDNHCK